MRTTFVLRFTAGLAVGLAIAALLGIGIVIGSRMTASSDSAPQWPFGEQTLYATGADSKGTFAMATGSIDDNTEGVFILDFLTGELQCAVMNYRSGEIFGAFKRNIAQDLPVDRTKDPSYLMVTAVTSFPRGSGPQPAQCVVWVLDTNTGQFAGYGFPWNRTSAVSGRLQSGTLTMLDGGSARTAAIAP